MMGQALISITPIGKEANSSDLCLFSIGEFDSRY